MSSVSSWQIRSLYRSFLRELPNRPLSSPSPTQRQIRSHLSSSPSSSIAGGKSNASPATTQDKLEEAEQFYEYAKAQRKYAMLVEKYNPGMSMSEEERVRLTMRRVGMDLPVEWDKSKGS